MSKHAEPKWAVEVVGVTMLASRHYSVHAKVSSMPKRNHDVVCWFTHQKRFCAISLEVDGQNENPPLTIRLWDAECWTVTVGSYIIKKVRDEALRVRTCSAAKGTELPVTDKGELAMAERCFRNAVKFFEEIVPELRKALPATKSLSDTLGRYKDIIG